MFTLYRIDFRSELFTPYQIDICFGLQKQTYPRVQESDNEIPFSSRKRADLLNSLFTSEAERSKKLSDAEPITFGIGAFQLVIVTGIVLDRWGQI